MKIAHTVLAFALAGCSQVGSDGQAIITQSKTPEMTWQSFQKVSAESQAFMSCVMQQAQLARGASAIEPASPRSVLGACKHELAVLSRKARREMPAVTARKFVQDAEATAIGILGSAMLQGAPDQRIPEVHDKATRPGIEI